MRYRVDDLAARSGLSVDTVRYYQALGLLPRPERQGRVAWYDATHLERLQRIRELKNKGFTLASIRRLLAGELDAADEALVEALAGAGSPEGELLTAAQLAQRVGVSEALLGAVEREGLLLPRAVDGEPRYTADDASALQAGLALLEAGVPLSELLALARRHDTAMREIANQAVDLFIRFVRDGARGTAASPVEAAKQVVAAFHRMLPATQTLVGHHFQRLVLAAAQARLEEDGHEAELVALQTEQAHAR